MLTAGLVGYGYWGLNLARTLGASARFDLKTVCDLGGDRLEVAGRNLPNVNLSKDFNDLVADDKIDAILIATPVRQHYDLAATALRAGKHVLLAKPMTETAEQAQDLIDLARGNNRVLLIDHTFLFSGAVQKMREIVLSGEIGEIYYYDSIRINLGLFQKDVNAVWDLAVHDLSILEYVLGQTPTAVSATGIQHIPGNPENMAFLTLFFANKTSIAHVNVNWLAPVKVRHTLIGGSKKMIVYNDLESTEKVKIYDTGVTVADDKEKIHQVISDYRTGDMWAPQIDRTEPLVKEINHFADCIEDDIEPISGGEMGLKVIKILEAALKSMAQGGTSVALD